MTFDTAAPDIQPEPDNTPAPSQQRQRALRSKMEAALLNRRLLGLGLLLVVAGMVARTLVFARETPDRRALSDLYMTSYEALSATKAAYTPDLIFASTAASPAPSALISTSTSAAGKARRVNPPAASPAKTGSSSRRLSALLGKRSPAKSPAKVRGDLAVQQWRDVVRSRQARAAEWRRLGIVLALFHRPGALDALGHVEDTFLSPLPSPRPKRASVETGNSDIDPFGHGPTGVSAKQEGAMWQALYGTQPITPSAVPGLQATLKKLRLGWFESIALAQLYQKGGLHTRAMQMATEADKSARRVRLLENTQVGGMALGFLSVIACGVVFLIRFSQRKQNAPFAPPVPAFSAQTAPMQFDFVVDANGYAPPPPAATSPQRPPFTTDFLDAPPDAITSALLLAFLIYLVSHTGFGLLTRQALRPFADRIDALNSTQLLRLNFALQILLYLPVFLVPLTALRARLAAYQKSHQSLNLGTLLTRLGCRCRSLLAEVRAGAFAYLLLMPFLLLAGMISHLLFHRFHTPVNPAQFETMAAQHLPEKVLIFTLAAIVAPIVEETMFRGLLYSALRARFGIVGAALLSAALFSLVHPTLPGGFLTIWAIGIALALVYERRKSLVPGMVLHGIHNGLITLLGFAVFGN